MRISIDIHTRSLVTVIQQPSLLEWFVGMRESNRMAVGLPALQGARDWYFEDGKHLVPVGPRVKEAIEKELARMGDGERGVVSL